MAVAQPAAPHAPPLDRPRDSPRTSDGETDSSDGASALTVSRKACGDVLRTCRGRRRGRVLRPRAARRERRVGSGTVGQGRERRRVWPAALRRCRSACRRPGSPASPTRRATRRAPERGRSRLISAVRRLHLDAVSASASCSDGCRRRLHLGCISAASRRHLASVSWSGGAVGEAPRASAASASHWRRAPSGHVHDTSAAWARHVRAGEPPE